MEDLTARANELVQRYPARAMAWYRKMLPFIDEAAAPFSVGNTVGGIYMGRNGRLPGSAASACVDDLPALITFLSTPLPGEAWEVGERVEAMEEKPKAWPDPPRDRFLPPSSRWNGRCERCGHHTYQGIGAVEHEPNVGCLAPPPEPWLGDAGMGGQEGGWYYGPHFSPAGPFATREAALARWRRGR